MTQIKNKIIVVGGGTAGLISALMLKSKYPDFEIKIIKSNKIGIIGVGEGSTEHWRDFLGQTNLDYRDFLKFADASIKGGVLFTGWTKEPYFHNLTGEFDFFCGQKLYNYMYHYANNRSQIETTSTHFLRNKVRNIDWPSNQFHFNTFKLNEYLQKICIERNINIIDDEIKDVIVEQDGIKELIGEKNKYKSDFYIDSTGFSKKLIKKLNSNWISYQKYLPLNEAIAFPTQDTKIYPAFTLAKAMKYGWMWRIPVYGRWGNGYIFDNNYITAEDAKQEVEQLLGHEIEIGKNIKFEAGCLDNSWIKNCLAIGLSSSFLEPLEATSIGYAITQMNLFFNYYNLEYNEKDISIYNNKLNSIVTNMRDFVQLHYIVDKKDTDFWKDIKNIKLSDTLSENLEKWKYRFPILEDFTDTQYLMFWENNFASVLYGLQLIDRESVKLELDTLSNNLNYENERVKWVKHRDIDVDFIDHKQYLTNFH